MASLASTASGSREVYTRVWLTYATADYPPFTTTHSRNFLSGNTPHADAPPCHHHLCFLILAV